MPRSFDSVCSYLSAFSRSASSYRSAFRSRFVLPRFCREVSERGLIASIYGTYATDVPDAYSRLEKQMAEASEPNASIEAKTALAKKQASIGVALLVIGKNKNVWPRLKHQADP